MRRTACGGYDPSIRLLLATVAVFMAMIALSVVAIASAASAGGQSAVPVGGMHDVTAIGHHWTTLHNGR